MDRGKIRLKAKLTTLFVAVGIIEGIFVSRGACSAANLTLNTDKLGSLSNDIASARFIAISANCKSVAVVTKSHDGRDTIDFNGKVVDTRDHIFGLAISPNGQHFAYAVAEGNVFFVVSDGKKGADYDSIPSMRLPDKSFYAELDYSENSEHLSYCAIKDHQMCQVVDGVEGPLYDSLNSFVFSPDGKRVAYVASTGAASPDWQLIVDGKAVDGAKSILRVAFSPDGKNLGYVKANEDAFSVVIAGKASEGRDLIDCGPIFSKDGKHVAYSALRRNGYEEILVVDGQVTSPDFGPMHSTGRIREIMWDATCKHLAYVRCDDFPDKQNKVRYQVVLDGKRGEYYYDLGELTFSSDGSQLLFPAKTSPVQWKLMWNGNASPAYEAMSYQAVIDKTGRHTAYGVKHGDHWVVVVDGQEMDDYGLIIPRIPGLADVQFKPDRAPFVFDDDGTLVYIGIKDGLLYRVKYRF